MTEPAPGGGSDPRHDATTAMREGDDWIVHGRKWFITGAGQAAHFILIARTDPDASCAATSPPSCSTATIPAGEIVRRIPIMGPEEHGGHCELAFDGLRIPDANRLMRGRRRAEGDADPPRHRRG